MNDWVNTGKYIDSGLLKDWKVDREELSVQRLSEIFGVTPSGVKRGTSQVDDDIV
jgi:hypothetical protein